MGRLLAIALVVAAAGIAVVAANGPGKDKQVKDKLTPRQQSAQIGSGSGPAHNVSTGNVDGAPAVTIRMKRLRFTPGEVTVRPGAIVRFVNRDNVAHTVVEDVGSRSGVIAAFESQRILPGEHFQIAASNAGSVIPFICTLHPTVMQGRIYVRSGA